MIPVWKSMRSAVPQVFCPPGMPEKGLLTPTASESYWLNYQEIQQPSARLDLSRRLWSLAGQGKTLMFHWGRAAGVFILLRAGLEGFGTIPASFPTRFYRTFRACTPKPR